MTNVVDQTIDRLRVALGPVDVAPIRGDRQAAVAAILRTAPATDELELLLIRRAERAGDVWSGHIALPGGRRDEGDADLVVTAVRETMEEVAVDLAAPGATLLGALPSLLPVNASLPPIAVQPYVWFVDDIGEPGTSDEVASVHWISLAHLLDERNHVEHGGFPAIHVGQDVPLWGMTHRIVGTLLTAARG